MEIGKNNHQQPNDSEPTISVNEFGEYNDEEIERALILAEEYITKESLAYAKLIGVDAVFKIGQNWETNLESGEISISPVFFVERDYEKDMVIYATLHELVAHYRRLINHPQLSDIMNNLYKEKRANAIFLNIIEDISGNKQIHSMLPRMSIVADKLYSEKLFPHEYMNSVDYSEKYPRHIQFLYRIIREEMIAESDTTVLPEVKKAIERLRNYDGVGDIIKYATRPVDSEDSAVIEEKFILWMECIYPEYIALLEIDKEDPKYQKKADENDATGGDFSVFDDYYDDYDKKHHASGGGCGIGHTEDGQAANPGYVEPGKKKIGTYQSDDVSYVQKVYNDYSKREKGYSLREKDEYMADVASLRDAINEMRECYKELINDRLTMVMRLSNRTYDDGHILDIERMPEVLADFSSGIYSSDVFKTIEYRKKQDDSAGKIDYIFLVDNSSSMQNERCKAAARAALVLIEGLSAVQEDVEDIERSLGLDLDIELRSAIYTFNSDAYVRKKLDEPLNEAVSIRTYQSIKNTSGSTDNLKALNRVKEHVKPDPDRKRVYFVITDGEVSKADEVKSLVANMRHDGDLVYCIGIGTEAATKVYGPYAKRIDDMSQLPDAIIDYIRESLG